MKPTKCAVIGCGGIAVYAAPMLSRLADLVLVDGDNYEKGNVDRQFPALHSTENKAKVLTELLQPNTLQKIQAIPEFLKGPQIMNFDEWEGVDLIVGAVDNTESRRIIVELCEIMNIPGILAGNEHKHGEAHLMIPGVYNPFDHFNFEDGEPTPWACNSDKQLSEHPQTALSNMLAAGATMHLLLSLGEAVNIQNAICYSRLDVFHSEYKRVKDMLMAKQVEEDLSQDQLAGLAV